MFAARMFDSQNSEDQLKVSFLSFEINAVSVMDVVGANAAADAFQHFLQCFVTLWCL